MRLIRLIDNWWECEICGDLYRYKKDAFFWCGSNCAYLKANKKIRMVSDPSLSHALGGLNMDWIPSVEEEKYLKLVISMSTDCLIAKGTINLSTYITNLRIICDGLEGIVNQEIRATEKGG